MEAKISPQLLDQRLRNRIIDVVEVLADGNDALSTFTPWGYFNWFFDFVPDDGEPHPNQVMTSEEIEKLRSLAQLMNDAVDDTPSDLTAENLIASGWPNRIKPVASELLSLFMRRGRFDEEHEEIEL